jgi:TM2 domain-containing membrane protein YozV
MAGGKSEKSNVVALLLCFFLGAFGVHRFYVGKVGTGVLQLVTLGGLGIWALIDFIMIVLQKFEDGEGNALSFN